MVNDEGQLYTIEGIAAAALILTTVYLVLNSTMVFTPGDTHVYDMHWSSRKRCPCGDGPTHLHWIPRAGPATKSRLEDYIEKNDLQILTIISSI